MTKFSALVLIITLRLIYQPSHAHAGLAPFASPSTLSSITLPGSPAKLISFNGSICNQKVILQWEVGGNETADQFEVEKSTDGINFKMVALVFGTDKAESGKYEFYEKAGHQKVVYRIKLINKDRMIEYSTMVEINANV